MDEVSSRYDELVARWISDRSNEVAMASLARDAELLAADVEIRWYATQAAALAAAARVASGRDMEIAVLIDAESAPVDIAAPERLGALLPGAGALSDRLASYRASMAVPVESLVTVAVRLVELFHERAVEDLGLPPDLAPPTVEVGVLPHRFRLDHDRLVFDINRRWSVAGLLQTVADAAVPGGYLASRLRPAIFDWTPSPQTTIDHGMRAVAREVLLGDHELAYELGRIGRAVGIRWPVEQIVAVERARGALAPSFARVALAQPHDVDALRRLGADDGSAATMLVRWADPLARADCAAMAAGPPIVRDWLVRVGQTTGLARLLTERLTPSLLRAETANA